MGRISSIWRDWRRNSLGGGCVLDLGVYAIQMALLVYDHEEPEKIIASGILNDQSGTIFHQIFFIHYSLVGSKVSLGAWHPASPPPPNLCAISSIFNGICDKNDCQIMNRLGPNLWVSWPSSGKYCIRHWVSTWPPVFTYFTGMVSYCSFTPFPFPLHISVSISWFSIICISPGVDYCDSITMYFKDKRVAQLNLHQESVLSNCAVISGDKGNIEVSGLYCKFQ